MSLVQHKPLDDDDARLIKAVHSRQILYDPRHPEFRSASNKDLAWDRIGSLLGCDATQARHRWTVLRERYTRDLKQLRQKPETLKIVHNTLFEKMDFLRDFVRNRRKRGLKTVNSPEKVTTARRSKKMTLKPTMSDDGSCLEQYGKDKKKTSVKYKVESSTEAATSQVENVESPADFAVIAEQQCVAYEEEEEEEEFTMCTSSMTSATSERVPRPGEIVAMPLMAPTVHVDILHTEERIEKTNLPPQATVQIIPPQGPAPSLQCQPQTQRDDNAEEDELFSQSIAAHLKLLSRKSKIKAKVEMYQVLEKYIIRDDSMVLP